MNDVIDIPDSQQQLKTIGHISYFLHAVVAVGAVHLVGPAGLLAALRRDGYRIEVVPL